MFRLYQPTPALEKREWAQEWCPATGVVYRTSLSYAIICTVRCSSATPGADETLEYLRGKDRAGPRKHWACPTHGMRSRRGGLRAVLSSSRKRGTEEPLGRDQAELYRILRGQPCRTPPSPQLS